jgi:hypothetical protein
MGADNAPRVTTVPADPRPSRFWINWLLAVASGVIAFGLALVLAPSFARRGFSLLVYASDVRIDGFGPEAVRYIGLAHAVIGAVMVGWGVALFYATTSLLARGDRIGWNLVAGSVAAWFVPDTAYSLISGYWQNALLNVAFAILFALPLWGIRSRLREDA